MRQVFIHNFEGGTKLKGNSDWWGSCSKCLPTRALGKPAFLQEMDKFVQDSIIVLGDFSVVCNSKVDRSAGRSKMSEISGNIREYISQHDLLDSWRCKNELLILFSDQYQSFIF